MNKDEIICESVRVYSMINANEMYLFVFYWSVENSSILKSLFLKLITEMENDTDWYCTR